MLAHLAKTELFPRQLSASDRAVRSFKELHFCILLLRRICGEAIGIILPGIIKKRHENPYDRDR